ncbi:hypothetical protein [Phreatobacter stygius]|uniref:Uncharacterized protein n=1 Tax=Phreatobacter stygius TaxID=1940610 RepID=A0A4D7B3M1_9HYPH|nr:hypothetical protein [Phreatobacter stygius]QCI65148.1 hypothetical protein E8M01_13565 [Phreatobacter stygius]
MTTPKRNHHRSPADELIVLDDNFDITRLRELVYWSQEPGLLELMRGILAMPDHALSSLQTFLGSVQAPEHLRVDYGADGHIRLTVAKRHS